MLTRTSPLLGTGTLTATEIDDVFAALGNHPVGLASSIVAISQRYGIDSDFLAFQVADETAWWTSEDALLRNNPSGFGHTDAAPSGMTFSTITDGITATVAHWLTYIMGARNPLAALDPRYALVSAEYRGTITVLSQIGGGVWASAPDYPQAILNRQNDALAVLAKGWYTGGNGSVAKQGGSMEPDVKYSLPVTLDLLNNGKSFPNRPTNPDGKILAIVKHVTAGESLSGALAWNRHGTNTDGSPVQASAHFYIDKTGAVTQDVSLLNGAWSNGILANQSLPAQFSGLPDGWNPNDFTISIEHVGMPDDPDFPTDAQLTADARLTADLCDFYKVPVDEDHIIGHYRFDSVNRANCPGSHWDFGRDVRAVSDLLNGGSNATGSTGTQSGGGASSGPTGSDGGSGKVEGDGYTVDSIVDSGDGRGASVTFPGSTTAYRVGGEFYDEWAGGAVNVSPAARFESAIARDGLPLSRLFTTVLSGVPLTVQIFQRAVYSYDGSRVSRLLLGSLWRDAHAAIIPTDTYRG